MIVDLYNFQSTCAAETCSLPCSKTCCHETLPWSITTFYATRPCIKQINSFCHTARPYSIQKELPPNSKALCHKKSKTVYHIYSTAARSFRHKSGQAPPSQKHIHQEESRPRQGPSVAKVAMSGRGKAPPLRIGKGPPSQKWLRHTEARPLCHTEARPLYHREAGPLHHAKPPSGTQSTYYHRMIKTHCHQLGPSRNLS